MNLMATNQNNRSRPLGGGPAKQIPQHLSNSMSPLKNEALVSINSQVKDRMQAMQIINQYIMES